jgi:hypothetical protein
VEFAIEFHDAADGADVEITLSGGATPESFRQFAETLGRDPRYRAGLRMLVDVSAFDVASLTDEQLQSLAQPVLERDWYRPPAAVAILAPEDRLNAARGRRRWPGSPSSHGRATRVSACLTRRAAGRPWRAAALIK